MTDEGRIETRNVENDRMHIRAVLIAGLFAPLIASAASNARAEEEMTWTVDRFERETADGLDTMVLRYGIPETDAVAVEATCGGPGGAAPRAVFWYDTIDLDEGEDVALAVAAGDFEDELPGKVYGKELEVGVSGVRVSVDADAPLWQAMASGPVLTYGIAEGKQEKLQLDGAAEPVAEFAAACQALASGASEDQTAAAPLHWSVALLESLKPQLIATAMAAGPEPQNGVPPLVDMMDPDDASDEAPSSGTPEMPSSEIQAGAPANPEAGTVSCDTFGTLKSMESDTPLSVTFVNKSDGYRAVLWIDTEGTPVDKGGLAKGESLTVATFKTHAWMLTDGPGNCIEMFVPMNDGDMTFEIEVPSPIFGDDQD